MRGRVREEGEPQAPALAIPPLSNSPPQGGIGHTVRGHSSHLQTAARPRIPRRELRPGCAKETSAPRKQRAWGMPGAGSHPQPRVQKQQGTRAQVTARTTGITRHSRTRMVLTVSFALFPVIGLCCHRRRRDAISIVANLMPASRHQNHTTSPSAPCAARLAASSRPPHPAPDVRDDRDTPLMWDRMSERCWCFGLATNQNIFSERTGRPKSR